jgi:ABC-type Mn2+/Zn2+ transport system ATPase subunit
VTRGDGAGPVAPLVRMRAVTCSYGLGAVVEDVSLTVAAGDFVGVVGPSGSGKTTLLRALLGTLAPRAGAVERTGGLRIGYVPQRDAVDWSFPVTVTEAVLMARPRGALARRAEARESPARFPWVGVPWAGRAERAAAADVLDRLGLGGLGDRHIRDLSGGQQQRVFIARALLRRPHLLVMDEPTAGVDVRTRHDLLHLLGGLHAGGLAVVLTTHDLNGMAAHLPRILCLNRRMVAEGPPRAVLTPAVLEQTYGAPMEVLIHGGMPVVVDRTVGAATRRPGHRHDPHPGGDDRPGVRRTEPDVTGPAAGDGHGAAAGQAAGDGHGAAGGQAGDGDADRRPVAAEGD